jgi:hypothetical protein
MSCSVMGRLSILKVKSGGNGVLRLENWNLDHCVEVCYGHAVLVQGIAVVIMLMNLHL